jgi:hypothetical protein
VQQGHVRRGCGRAEPAHALQPAATAAPSARSRRHAVPPRSGRTVLRSLSRGASAERRGSRGVAGRRYPGWSARASRMTAGPGRRPPRGRVILNCRASQGADGPSPGARRLG